jgi:hypothetical protein
MTFSIKETAVGVAFKVRVLPRSSRCEVVGIQDDALKLKITAPPVEGQANEECIRFLSRLLDVKRNSISITAGGKSKNKSITITGVTRKDIESIIPM